MGARKQFTPEFKREVVQLLEGGRRPASEMARELGIARNQLYKWQTELRARGMGAFPGPGARKERTTEMARLKRELARVTEEGDLLKKPPCTLPRIRGEVRLHSGLSPGVSCDSDVSSAPDEPERLLYLTAAPGKSADSCQSGPDRADARPPSAYAKRVRRPQDVAATEPQPTVCLVVEEFGCGQAIGRSCLRAPAGSRSPCCSIYIRDGSWAGP
jgi:transposase